MSRTVNDMFSRISTRYDLTNDILSLGIHRSWRALVRRRARLNKSDLAVDLCTGTGDLAFELAKVSGAVVALDFVRPMLDLAEKKKAKSPRGICPVVFVKGDALYLPLSSGSADFVSISFGIRNLDDPLLCLREIYRVLKPGAKVIVLEFGQPTTPLVAPLYRFYSSTIMPRLGGMLSGDRAAYEYLPQTSAKFPCGERFTAMMREVGFKDCNFTPLSFGVAYLYEARK